MARRSKPPIARPHADLTDGQKRVAIPRLLERVKELQSLDTSTIQDTSDDRIVALETRIQQTLASVYGPESHQYSTLFQASNLRPHFAGPLYFGVGRAPPGPTPAQIQGGVAERCNRSAAMLTEAARSLQEELGLTQQDPGDRALRAYAEMDLHPTILDAVGTLYEDGHYANAIEDAVKALNDLVRLKSGENIDGESLMTTAFSPTKPILRFNDLQDDSDRNEQRGFMMMFAGAVAGLRNPRAHKLIKDDPERALEFIAFVSLLAKLLGGAKRVSRQS